MSTAHHGSQGPRSRWVTAIPTTPAILALVVGAMVACMFAAQRSGHWWGDDWALYVNQAEGLLHGRPGRVFADNRFTVEQSLGPPFSPPLYPWGFPIILVPFVAVVGTDLDRLAIVPIVCSAAFACSWFALARRRLSTATAMVGTVAVTITPLLFGWTELIQSEWPFLAVTGAVLVGLDRAAASGSLLAGRWSTPVLLGLGAAAAFTVRREGLAMVAAVSAAQLAALVDDPIRRWRWAPGARRLVPARLALPHVTTYVAIELLQWLLPSTLVPRYEGTSISNTWRFADRHVKHLAEISGLKRPWDRSAVVLGSTTLGWLAVAAFLAAGLAGIALAIVRFRTRDLHLVGYVVVAFAIGGSFRSAINRYLCTVGPVLVLLGLVAVVALVGLARRPRWTAVATTAIVTAIALGNLANVHVRVERAETVAAAGTIEWGPTHPDAVAMFDQVRALTDRSDIVAAPKARAMTLLTGRRAVQVDDARPIPATIDLAVVVTERTSQLSRELLGEPTRWSVVWSNGRFLIFRPAGGDDPPARD